MAKAGSAEFISRDEFIKRLKGGELSDMDEKYKAMADDFFNYVVSSARLFKLNVPITSNVGLNLFMVGTKEMAIVLNDKVIITNLIDETIKVLEDHKKHLLDNMDDEIVDSSRQGIDTNDDFYEKEFDAWKKSNQN
ncbi:MAG: hypothetical protein EPN25_15395 [Nitrospirae bacterium]|nr:MAG: hypothetical protein EPN25_15395 [Nitrospirota bacterium]